MAIDGGRRRTAKVGRWTRFDPALAAAAVAAVLVGLEALRPYFFLEDDNRGDFLPLFVHDWRALLEGRFALFNFHQFLGAPHLAAGQTMALYAPAPVSVGVSLALLGHPFAAIDLFSIAHLALGAAGAFALSRRLQASRPAAAFAAAAWALNPFALVIGRVWATVMPTVALLPWTTLLSIDALEGGAPVSLGALVAARTALFLCGYVEFALYAVGFEAAFAALAARRNYAARWAATLPLTALTSSPLLLPMAEAVARSAERAQPLSSAARAMGTVAAADWLTGLVWPYGAALDASTGLPGTYRAISFLGWPAAALAAFGALRAPRERWTVAAGVLAVAGVVWACGALDAALAHAPLLNRFRFHFKLLLFTQFFVVLLAARGASRLSPRAAAAALALQVAAVLGLAAAAPRRGFIRDTDRPPLVEPLAGSLTPGRIVSLGRWRGLRPSYTRTVGFNFATLWNLDHFAGYDPLVARVNAAETFRVNEDALLDAETERPDFIERLRGWGVRWYVVPAEQIGLYAALLRRVGARLAFSDGGRDVYDDPRAAPMLYWADSGAAAGAPRFQVNEAEAVVESVDGGVVVLNVLASSGFDATVDGIPAPLEVEGGRRLAVRVAGGRRRVRWRYDEPGFRLGLALAAAAALGFGLWAGRVGLGRPGPPPRRA